LKQLEKDQQAMIALGDYIIQGSQNTLNHVEDTFKNLPLDLQTNAQLEQMCRVQNILQEMLQRASAPHFQNNQQKDPKDLMVALGRYMIQGNQNAMSHLEFNVSKFPDPR
jgi:hypothetical protein